MPLSNPSNIISFPNSTAITKTNVAASITSVPILSGNGGRKGATIWNSSTSNLYIEFGTTPTISSFAVKISPDGYYELPFNYVGVINGIWEIANGTALVREMT